MSSLLRLLRLRSGQLAVRKPTLPYRRRAFSTSVLRAMAQEFKLKRISGPDDLADGSMKQVEVEGAEGGKVLLSKVSNKLHATSANCTHYGAPLEKGVLSPDGRLTCPWHGACFSVTTGDVEDAPAPDPLSVYELVEKPDGVYIRTDAATLKTNRRPNAFACKASGPEQIVVVGGGSGAFGFLQALRENGSTAAVTAISNEGYLAIDRPKLSKALIADPEKVQLRSQKWHDDAAIATVADEVTGVDVAAKKVRTKGGKEFPYTKLVLATGGTPKRLPLPGFKELGNVFVLRNVHDVQAILGAAGGEAEKGKGKQVVVVGSSFIGMEAASALAGKGHRVTVVGMESAPLETVMGARVGNVFRKNLEKMGIEFKMGASVDKASPAEGDAEKVGAVHLKDGTRLPADLVVLGVGVRPATDFLRDAEGVTLEQDGSLRTDRGFAVEGLDGVYAVGDIATYPYDGPGARGQPVRIEHWNVAQNAGRVVGKALAKPGASKEPKSFVPVFWSALGAQLRYCGHVAPKSDDDVLITGTPDEGKFVAYYAVPGGDEVAAVATMGSDPVMVKCADLMRRGKMPGKKALAGGLDPLQV